MEKEIRRIMRITPEEKRKILEEHNKPEYVIRTGGFYSKPGPTSAVNRFDRASVRYTAGIYVQDA